MAADIPRAESRDQFDRQAVLYAASPVHRQGPSLPVLVEYAAPVPEDIALDVATGTGNTAFAIADLGAADVVGIDISTGMLNQARRRAESEGYANVRFEEGSAEAIPFADRTFTLVTARHAPHHFRDAARFLLEGRRVLAPGGRFVMADGISPNDESSDWLDRWQRLRDPSHYYARTVREWSALASTAGLSWSRHTIVPYRLEFAWWVRQSGASPETIAELRAMARSASPAIRESLGLEYDEEGEVIAFHDPMVVVRMEPRL